MEEKFGISTKKYMVEELKKKFRASSDFVITNCAGVAVPELEKLRKSLHEVSGKYVVVKNSLVKRALDELELKGLEQFIEGEVGIGFAGDAIKASKTLVNFAKVHKSFKLGCAFIDGKKEEKERIQFLATLPSKEALLGMVASYMKSPITGFVGVLSGLLRKLVIVVSEIKEKRQK